jgi:hypothetical protein
MRWPLPLFDGVSTGSVAPASNSRRADSYIAFTAKAEPVSRWHQLQWQQWTKSGGPVTRKRTWPQAQ